MVDDEFTRRADKAVKDGERPTIGADSTPEDIRAAFHRHDLLEPRPTQCGPVKAEVVSVTEAELRRWFVAFTAPRQEDLVARKLGEYGLHGWSPKLTQWQRILHPKPRGPTKKAVTCALFPRYIFVGFPYGQEADFGFVTSLDEVQAFLGARGTPQEIRERTNPNEVTVAKLLASEQAGLFDLTRDRPPSLKKGDFARIVSGPFSRFVAEIRTMKSGDRVKALVSCFGSATEIEIKADMLEKIVA